MAAARMSWGRRPGRLVLVRNGSSFEQRFHRCVVGHGGGDRAEADIAFIAQKSERIEEEDPPADIDIHGGDAPCTGGELGLGDLIRAALVQASEDAPTEAYVLD